MSTQHTHTGTCFCGEVEIEVSGEAVGMGYCHCDSCRHWSAGPVNAFTLWTASSFRVVRGQNKLARYNKTPDSDRHFCKNCGGHVYIVHPGPGLVDVPAALLSSVDFRPGVHVHYQESVLSILDGLPKQKDLPAEMGGAGELVAE